MTIRNRTEHWDGRVVERLRAKVSRYCLSLTGSRFEAEDLAQDTWLKAIGGSVGFGHANPEALLLRIAKNTWIDRLRRNAVHNRYVYLLQPEAEQVPDHGTAGLEVIFNSLYNHLSPLQLAVFLLRDVLGYSSAETSELLRTTEGAVKAALHRARRSLEGVQKEVVEGSLPLPNDEGAKTLLRAISAAYALGDAAALVRLALQDLVEPASAIGVAQTAMVQRRARFRRERTQLRTQLAA